MGEYAEDRIEQEMQNAGALDRPFKPNKPYMWKSKDGSRQPIHEMSDSHIKNTYHYLINSGREGTLAFSVIKAQMEMRELDMSGLSESKDG